MRRSAPLLPLAATLLAAFLSARPAAAEPDPPGGEPSTPASPPSGAERPRPTEPAAPTASSEPAAGALAHAPPPGAAAPGDGAVGPPPPTSQKARGLKASAGAEGAAPDEPEKQPAAELRLPGHWVARHVFPEERYPEVDPKHPWAAKFGVHGYVRAPLRLAVRERENPPEGEAQSDVRTPWLVDDDYFRSGFAYTPVNETDFGEVYFMAGNQLVTGNVALMASLFSDSARVMLDQQLGIAQAWVTFRHALALDPVTVRLRAKGGAFWDRLGWLPQYDTYLFGRTHQIGGQLDAELDAWRMTFGVTGQYGVHREAIEANQGFTQLAFVRLRAAYDGIAELGLHYISTWAQDQRQLSEIRDARMNVVGADARIDTRYAGRAYGILSAVNTRRASFLSPSLELMHSHGGRGITENYLGTASSNDGTGDLWNVGAEHDLSVADTLAAVDPALRFPLDGDVSLSLFMLYSFVNSDQVSDTDPEVNRDNRGYFKHGLELAWWILPWVGISARYDRVVPDLEDEPSSFRIITPRVALRGRFYGAEALLFYQLSHYDYGERVGLRPGQVPNETLPDVDVHKIQGQLTF